MTKAQGAGVASVDKSCAVFFLLKRQQQLMLYVCARVYVQLLEQFGDDRSQLLPLLETLSSSRRQAHFHLYQLVVSSLAVNKRAFLFTANGYPSEANLPRTLRQRAASSTWTPSDVEICGWQQGGKSAFGPPNAPCTVAARQVNARQLPQATWELAAAKRRRGANAGYVFSESWIRVLIVLLGDRLLS